MEDNLSITKSWRCCSLVTLERTGEEQSRSSSKCTELYEMLIILNSNVLHSVNRQTVSLLKKNKYSLQCVCTSFPRICLSSFLIFPSLLLLTSFLLPFLLACKMTLDSCGKEEVKKGNGKWIWRKEKHIQNLSFLRRWRKIGCEAKACDPWLCSGAGRLPCSELK